MAGSSLAQRTIIPGRASIPTGTSPVRAQMDAVRRGMDAWESRLLGPTLEQMDGILAKLDFNLRQVTAQIDAAIAAGTDIRPTWFYNERRYAILLADYERQMLELTKDLSARFAAREPDLVAKALADAPKTLRAVTERASDVFPGVGGAPDMLAVTEAFDTIGAGNLAEALKQTATGTPLALLLAEIAPATTDAVANALTAGIVSGESIPVTIRKVKALAQAPVARIRTIVRTETLRTYRNATRAAYDAAEVVNGWVWHSTTDLTTCPICWALHGRTFPTSEMMPTHPNCRCAMLPAVKSWSDLGLDLKEPLEELPTSTEPLGPDLFAKLSPADQRTILGPARFNAYSDGALNLRDIPRRTTSPFGPGMRAANLRELGITEYRVGGPKAPPIGKPKPRPKRRPAKKPKAVTKAPTVKRTKAKPKAKAKEPTTAPAPQPHPAKYDFGRRYDGHRDIMRLHAQRAKAPTGLPADVRAPAHNILSGERATKALKSDIDDTAQDLRDILPNADIWPENLAYGKLGGPHGYFGRTSKWPRRGTAKNPQRFYDDLIQVDSRYPRTSASTYAHEFGHWLDLSFAGENHAARKALTAVIKKSDKFKELKSWPASKFKTYAISDKEIIARAFAQYVGTRPGASAAARKSFEALKVEPGWSHATWTDADFKPIAKAIEQWLKEIGAA